MKLRKLILPALLTLGLAGGLVFSGEMTNNPEVKVSAMADYTGDPEIDVGINIKSNSNSSTTDFPIVSFYVNHFDSVDVSGGDYLAFRLRSNNAAGSYLMSFQTLMETQAEFLSILKSLESNAFQLVQVEQRLTIKELDLKIYH